MLLIVIGVLLVTTSCGSTNSKKDKLSVNMKIEGWISDNMYIVKANGIGEPNMVGEEAIISSKKSAILNAQQKILQQFRKVSFASRVDKTVKGRLIIEMIQMGKILHHNCKENRCTIRYSVEFQGLKGLIEKSDLKDYILIN